MQFRPGTEGAGNEQIAALDSVGFLGPTAFVLQVNYTDFDKEYFIKSCFVF